MERLNRTWATFRTWQQGLWGLEPGGGQAPTTPGKQTVELSGKLTLELEGLEESNGGR